MTLLQILFSFKGRINRAKYWTIHLLLVAVTVLVFFICANINNTAVSALLFFYFI